MHSCRHLLNYFVSSNSSSTITRILSLPINIASSILFLVWWVTPADLWSSFIYQTRICAFISIQEDTISIFSEFQKTPFSLCSYRIRKHAKMESGEVFYCFNLKLRQLCKGKVPATLRTFPACFKSHSTRQVFLVQIHTPMVELTWKWEAGRCYTNKVFKGTKFALENYF